MEFGVIVTSQASGMNYSVPGCVLILFHLATRNTFIQTTGGERQRLTRVPAQLFIHSEKPASPPLCTILPEKERKKKLFHGTKMKEYNSIIFLLQNCKQVRKKKGKMKKKKKKSKNFFCALL